MALGFGFNKTKVLSSAEKFVQQGKLQNAITEYEKVVKEDPKDLTVLNTIGDLYARVGQNDKACEYFKKVGDQYAQNGFTVKAIAIYKKLSKLSSSADAIIKLAELYTQQGLFNDARTHYMQVADHVLKAGDNNQAAKILQKILELDPENTTTQSKLADLYIKLGKKEEARNIYYSAAESLHARRAFDAADEALGRVLSLEPDNKKALLLRGMGAAESGDSSKAIQCLEQVPDLDSRPDGLRALLRAKLQSGVVEGNEALAIKLFTVHQDLGGITALTEWMVAHNHVEDALKLYDQYAERFFSRGPSALIDTLYPLIARIRNNPFALERMLRLLQKAGDTSHLNEVMELLAHARVQTGDFGEARDLYKQLSELEPENPLHVQNYRQMQAKLGEDPMNRMLTAAESNQALMVEELEHTAAAVHQEYTPAVERAIEAALTDAELFISYNVPLKAIAPLEAILPVAPRDLQVNQRLASLYLRAGRYKDASNACKTLSELYAQFGHTAEAERYGEEAQKYGARSAIEEMQPPPPAKAQPVAVEEPEPVVEQSAPASTVQEFVLEVPQEFFESPIAEAPPAPIHEPAPDKVSAEATVQEFGLEPAVPQTQEVEVDVSHEWESMLSVESEAATPVESAAPAVHPDTAAKPEPVAAGPDPAVIEDKIQEVRFYISQGFWDMAQAAIHDLAETAPGNPQLDELRSAVAAGEGAQMAAEAEAAAAAKAAAEAEAAAAKAVAEAEAAAVAKAVSEAQAAAAAQAKAAAEAEAAEAAKAAAEIEAAAAAQKRVEPSPSSSHGLAVKDAEPLLVLDEEGPVLTGKQVASPPPSVAPVQPVAAPKRLEEEEDILGNLVSDLEASLGDFVPGGDAEPAQPMPASASVTPTAEPAPALAPPVPIQASAATSLPTNGEIRDPEATSVLSNILSELQEDLGEDVVEAEDPETHYNLGIAFKEMGLLDEAIGELQKVCHAVERGNNFSQPIQAYTWLAQCLVDKGVPEASLRWYEKALQLPGLDHTSRCAIYYDLGSAYEASGDKKSALANFMEVYSSNIDFRDVASRIKVLKS
ncbi:MAG TPA: tetratricopeptide repeat protein [Candidatus Angelobacter sp.]